MKSRMTRENCVRVIMSCVCGCAVIALTGCASMAWKQATADDTIPAYTRFLGSYPNSEFSADATKRLDALRAQEREREIQQQFADAQQRGQNALERFAGQYPSHALGKKASEMARQIEEREGYEYLEKHEFEWMRSTAFLAKYAHAARQAEVVAKMKPSLIAAALSLSRPACEAFQRYFPADPQADEVAKALEKAKAVEKMSEIGNILLPLMPQMLISSQGGASLKSEKAEDDVLPEVTRLLHEGADPLRVKIVGFSKPKVERMGMFASRTSSGSAGRVVSVDDPSDGITLLAYCESVNCWKIASAFMAYNSQRNTEIMKTDAQLAQLSGAAAKGDIVAQKRLATMLLNGTSPLQKDVATAIKYYEMAAGQNDAEAERLLGNIYSEQGSVKSSKQAVEWYTKAVAKRDAQAMYELGLCYQRGFGVEKDMNKAIAFFTQSMELGCADAQNIMGYFLFGGEHLAKDQARAIALWEKAASQNHAMAMCSLGWSYQQGEGVTKDLEKARSWYRRAIECSTGESNAYARKLLEQMD